MSVILSYDAQLHCNAKSNIRQFDPRPLSRRQQYPHNSRYPRHRVSNHSTYVEGKIELTPFHSCDRTGTRSRSAERDVRDGREERVDVLLQFLRREMKLCDEKVRNAIRVDALRIRTRPIATRITPSVQER